MKELRPIVTTAVDQLWQFVALFARFTRSKRVVMYSGHTRVYEYVDRRAWES